MNHRILLPLLLLRLLFGGAAAGQEPQAIPIREALRDADGNYVPDRLGETVTLVGVLTTGPRPVTRGSVASFQDATGGILLYSREKALLAGFERGDRVQARGKIGQFRGAEQLEMEEVRRLGEGEMPRPRDVRAADLHSERYSGQLVRVVGELLVPPNLLATREGLMLRDRSGQIPVHISSRFLENPKFAERLLKGGRVELIGIAGQSKQDPPFNSGYELMPRGPSDYHFAPVPPYQAIGLTALALLFCGVFAYLWLRRREAERHALDMRELSESLKRSEKALRASETRLRSIIEAEPECVNLVAPDGTLLEINPAGLAMIEAERPADVIGKSVYSLVVPEHREAFRELTESVSGGNKATLEFEIVGLKGTRRWLETHAVPLRDGVGGGPLVLTVTRDITERRHLEEQLRQSQKMEALGLLAGGIAHDFNNASAAILGWAELGLKEMPPDHPLHQRLEKIRDQARHTAELTRQLLAFASRQILEPRKTNLNQTVASVVGLLENVIGEQIEVKTALAPDLWDVWADPSQCEQVLMNLCLNARDAMPQGGRMLIETQNLDLKPDDPRHPGNARPGPHVLLSVSDAGVGMDFATIRRMFEPFYTTKETARGSGLGLSVVYGIVRQHDGFLYVSSEPGRGTTFRVYLPVGAGPAEQPPRQETPALEAVRGGKETILVAEDHEGAREVAQETLESLGYEVLLACDGQEALSLFRNIGDRIALVVLDVALPRLSGPEAYAQMSAARPGVPVLFITGYSTEARQLSSLIEKGATILQKPYSPDHLGQKVRQTLDLVRKT